MSSELSSELSANEHQILELLSATQAPLDAIGLASELRLQVEDVLAALNTLESRGLITKADPEPVHERFEAEAVV